MSTVPDPATTDWVPLWSLTDAIVYGREIASMQQTSAAGPTGVTQTSDGDLLYTFPAAYYEAIPHLFELWLQVQSNAGNEAIYFRLHDTGSPGTLVREFVTRTPASNPGGPSFFRDRFTPTAGMHTYSIRWRGGSSGQFTLVNASYPLLARIVEIAPSGGLPSRPTYGVALPSSPVDSDEHILVDSITNPSYQWRFRYNAGSSSAYKWEFVGGVPVIVAGDPNAVLNTKTQIAASGYYYSAAEMTFTVPRAGDWLIEASMGTDSNGAGAGSMSTFGLFAGSTVPVAHAREDVAFQGTTASATASLIAKATALAASTLVGAAYSGASVGTHKMRRTTVMVTPVRIS